MKRVVIYYSLTENTKEAAEKIAAALSTDILQIETEKPMPNDFGKQMMLGGMQATFGMKPKLKNLPDVSDYDEIILGTPIWAGKHAPAIHTLLASKEIREKVTAVFTLSGGGDNEKCIARLQKMLPNLRTNVALADKKLGRGEEDENRLRQFIDSIQ